MGVILAWLAKRFALSALKTAGSAIWSFVSTPPGLYVALGCGVLLGLWGVHHIGYSAGVADAQAACKAAQALAVTYQQKASVAAVAASDKRTASDEKIMVMNREVVRYVTREAAKLPDGGAECIPASLADRLRDLR